MDNKTATTTILTLGVIATGATFLVLDTSGSMNESLVEKTQVEKPTLDSKIDAALIAEQAQAISQKGTYEHKVIDGTDGVKREVIPYGSPDGRKGYTVVYEKKEILIDKNGSTTEKVYRQQVDYGHEGRTTLW